MSKLIKTKALLKSAVLLLATVMIVGLAVDLFRFKQSDVASLSGQTMQLLTRQLSHEQRQGFDKGEPMLVYVWATWCGFCKVTSGAVDNISEDHPVATIALQSGSGAAVAKYLADKAYRFGYYNDYDGALTRSLDINVTPTFLIVDNEGDIKFMSVGMTTEVSLRAKLSVF